MMDEGLARRDDLEFRTAEKRQKKKRCDAGIDQVVRSMLDFYHESEGCTKLSIGQEIIEVLKYLEDRNFDVGQYWKLYKMNSKRYKCQRFHLF